MNAEATRKAPLKKRKMIIFMLALTDSDTDNEAESIQITLDHYKTESKTDMNEYQIKVVVKKKLTLPSTSTHCLQISLNTCHHFSL